MTIKRYDKPVIETLAAALVPASVDADNNTIDLKWYTGATVLRGGLWSDPYELRFDMSEGAADMSRADRGGIPLLANHDSRDISNVLGRVVPGSMRIEDGVGLATVVLSERAEVAGLVADVKAGILSNVSMGALISQRTIEQRENQHDLHIATAWGVHELSIVAVQADPDAATLSDDTPRGGLPYVEKETLSGDVVANNAGDGDQGARVALGAEMEKLNIDAKIEAALVAEKERCAAIDAAAGKLGVKLDDPAVVAMRADRSASVADCRERLWSMATAANEKEDLSSATSVRLVRDAADSVVEGIGGAIAHKLCNGMFPAPAARGSRDSSGFRSVDLSDNARRFVGLSATDMIRETLLAKGANVRYATPYELAKFATNPAYALEKLGMTTGDFSNLTSTSANKLLLGAYKAAAQEWKDSNGGFVTRGTLKDYKQHTAIRLSEQADLEVVPEGGEYKAKVLSEQAETYTAKKRGNVLKLTRELLINDDLNGFGQRVQIQGRASASTESALVVSLIEGSDTMSDGDVLFHANHNNLRASGGAPSVSEIKQMRILHGAQTGVGGNQIDTPLVFGFFGNDTIDAAEDLLTGKIVPTSGGNILTDRTRFVALYEPRLAATVYYTVTSAIMSGIHYGYVNGAEGPQLEIVDDPMHDSQAFKVRLEFATWLSDFRGLYKNAGA